MNRRPIAQVRILKLPRLHAEAIRVEVDCCYTSRSTVEHCAVYRVERTSSC
jgi:hypothetical protein